MTSKLSAECVRVGRRNQRSLDGSTLLNKHNFRLNRPPPPASHMGCGISKVESNVDEKVPPTMAPSNSIASKIVSQSQVITSTGLWVYSIATFIQIEFGSNLRQLQINAPAFTRSSPLAPFALLPPVGSAGNIRFTAFEIPISAHTNAKSLSDRSLPKIQGLDSNDTLRRIEEGQNRLWNDSSNSKEPTNRGRLAKVSELDTEELKRKLNG